MARMFLTTSENFQLLFLNCSLLFRAYAVRHKIDTRENHQDGKAFAKRQGIEPNHGRSQTPHHGLHIVVHRGNRGLEISLTDND